MIDNHQLLQEMIDIVRNGKKLSDTVNFSNSKLDEFTVRKLSIPNVLTWLFIQDFPGDIAVAKIFKSFSSKPVVQLVTNVPELQKYFQIKDGVLAFTDHLSQEDASEILKFVKKNYQPQVNIDFSE